MADYRLLSRHRRMGIRFENAKGAKEMKCFFCKGNLKNATTDYIVNLKSCIIIIKNVPCEECSQCGETYYNDETAQKLETIVNKVKDMVRDVAIFEYENIVA